MNKKVRRLSILIAFFTAFIFQISTSLEMNNRGIRQREEKLSNLTKRLDQARHQEARIAILKRLQTNREEEIVVYLDESGNILYTNTFEDRAKDMATFVEKKASSNQTKGWELYEKGLLENKYLELLVYPDGSRFIGVIAYDSMLASSLHFLPYTILSGLAGGALLYFLLRYSIEKHQEETKFLLRNIKKYVDNESYDLKLTPEVADYETILREESHRIRKKIDKINSQLTGLTDMVGNMTEGVILVDKDRKIASINDAAVKLLNGSIHIHYENKDLMYLSRNRDFYTAFSYAYEHAKDDSRRMDIDGLIIKCFFNPVFTEAGDFYGILILMIDETQQSLAERSRREFTSNVTHELKTPLTSISGYAELLQSGMVKEEDQKRFLNIIIEESKNLFELIDAVISMSRLEEKNRPEEYALIQIESLIKEILQGFQPDFEAKKLHVRFQSHPDATLYTHPELMKELLTNLIDNAVNYNVEGGDILITLNADDKDTFVITIEDTGIGISYDDQKRIFERFYMVDKSRSYNQKSTGLGLAIVKHNVDSLKGTIELKSQINHGTIFILKFPKSGTVSTQ